MYVKSVLEDSHLRNLQTYLKKPMKYITMLLDFHYENRSREHYQKQKPMADTPLSTNVSSHGTTY